MMAMLEQSWIRSGMLLVACLALVGCNICANPFEEDYVTYGSRTPRQNMKYGRVGSPFSDTSMTGSLPAESVEAIDDAYAEILESDDSGPVFLDEPLEESTITESPGPQRLDGPILLGPTQ